jgi:hypothetical protein
MNIPRFTKSPIDTSVFNYYMTKKRANQNIVCIIRKAVTEITGTDPYFDNTFRGGEFVKARQLFVYFVKDNTKLSLMSIGRLINKDHTTVIHSVRTVENYLATDKQYVALYTEISKKINSYKN